jgi:hypothetical protein
MELSQGPNRDAPPTPKTRSSSLVVTARALLLFLAAGAVVLALFLTKVDGKSDSRSKARYSCPMHPDVSAPQPGDCPICGMALRETLAASESPPSAETLVRLQPSLIDMAKKRVFTHELQAAAWVTREGIVQALLYGDEIPSLAAKEHGFFHPTATPDVGVAVHLGEAPAMAWDESTSMIEFELERSQPRLEVGTPGWLDLGAKPRSALVVPSAAIIHSSSGTYVLAASADGRTFAKRPVHIGKTLFGLTAVMDGMYERERVAARSTFFLDAEDRLRADLDATAAVKP